MGFVTQVCPVDPARRERVARPDRTDDVKQSCARQYAWHGRWRGVFGFTVLLQQKIEENDSTNASCSEVGTNTVINSLKVIIVHLPLLFDKGSSVLESHNLWCNC